MNLLLRGIVARMRREVMPTGGAFPRLNKPEQTYRLSPGDVGYYLMASGCSQAFALYAGQIESVVCAQVIRTTDGQGAPL
jgi:hypothetical protein